MMDVIAAADGERRADHTIRTRLLSICRLTERV